MTIKARLGRLEREAWKRNLTGKPRRVHYVVTYAQDPGETGPPDIACEFDMYEKTPPGPNVTRYEAYYETQKPDEN